MAVAQTDLRRQRLEVEGVVQGVGFRPFVHALAQRNGLSGWVRNEGAGVVIEVEGERHALAAFAAALAAEAPPLASVEQVRRRQVPVRGGHGFAIARSAGGRALVPPDVATCEDCLRELWDPADRRHRYPFINCTQCGPRFTIVLRTPYDRANTTMAGFEMCADCRREYEDPSDRRFHAEPIACPACGPRLSMPLEDAAAQLLDGRIVAVKGLGGWHLACDAADERAVARLRAQKEREEKPLALMTHQPDDLVVLDERERELVRSPTRPIVLGRRRAGGPVAAAVAPGTEWLGVMLPYTPLHHLLLAECGRALVMTSGNRTDEPIAVGDAEARERLGDIADAFLGHDRPIHRRCEDSVVRAAFPLRRSRGYSPGAVALPVSARRPLVAVGAELKSTFCVARGREAFLSAHLGDLDSQAAYRAFRADLELHLQMLGVRPEVVAHDLHPDYLSTRWALEQEAETLGVQHHHAHAAACLAEHRHSAVALAIVLDGTGYGVDGTLWGGELLRCDLEAFERVAHLEAVPLPGGEQAVREPWRVAAAHLERLGLPVPWERWQQVRQALDVNAPLSSGAGRLFDAAAALLGVRERVTYEGQAAIELEQLAASAAAGAYACRVEDGVIRSGDLIAAIHDDLAAGRERAQIAAAFHEGLARAFMEAAQAAAGPRVVALSGGCLQNRRLARALRERLTAAGFQILEHREVPPNDGGVSYGQAVVAASCA